MTDFSRIIECKWIGSQKNLGQIDLHKLKKNSYLPPKGYDKKLFLITNQTASKQLKSELRKQPVSLLSLEQLF